MQCTPLTNQSGELTPHHCTDDGTAPHAQLSSAASGRRHTSLPHLSMTSGHSIKQRAPFKGLPGGAGGKDPACEAGGGRDVGSIAGSGRCPGGGHGNPLQSSCLQNPIDRGAWWATVRGVAQSQTRLKQLSTAHSRASFKELKGGRTARAAARPALQRLSRLPEPSPHQGPPSFRQDNLLSTLFRAGSPGDEFP